MKDDSIFKAFEFDQICYHHVDFDYIAQTFPAFDIKRLPFSLRVLLESNLRRSASVEQQRQLIQTFNEWGDLPSGNVNVYATRLLLQDYTGIPVLVDLCALRQVAVDAGLDFNKVNPLVPMDLVVDHSIVVDDFWQKH